jgi:hypothetical protein
MNTGTSQTNRSLFFQVMRDPRMRLLRGALAHLRDDRGFDWRQVTSIAIDENTPAFWLDHWLVICDKPEKKRLTYDDFHSYHMHDLQDPCCPCEYCNLEKLDAEQQANLAAFFESISAYLEAVILQSGPIQDEYCWMHSPGGWCCEQCAATNDLGTPLLIGAQIPPSLD